MQPLPHLPSDAIQASANFIYFLEAVAKTNKLSSSRAPLLAAAVRYLTPSVCHRSDRTFPMVDWDDPQTIKAQGFACVKLIHVLAGLYLCVICIPQILGSWEYVSNIHYEWEFITRKRPYRWTIWLYSGTRFCVLMNIILGLVAFNPLRPMNCELWLLFDFVRCQSGVESRQESLSQSGCIGFMPRPQAWLHRILFARMRRPSKQPLKTHRFPYGAAPGMKAEYNATTALLTRRATLSLYIGTFQAIARCRGRLIEMKAHPHCRTRIPSTRYRLSVPSQLLRTTTPIFIGDLRHRRTLVCCRSHGALKSLLSGAA
ncbi:hypothetical protein FA95DRAFT_51326 [Auriscalpium vulgare]|uniref:Uncharacterized protein n=1 Tax=Auriscalpium vulgare TaxID=40419 RepID=A0ACB8S7Z6_9AGAM|nr:hypothetical protein FA95DRAFT_51326 [Auriscalpium vulgare]